jgi:hypothetical protein
MSQIPAPACPITVARRKTDQSEAVICTGRQPVRQPAQAHGWNHLIRRPAQTPPPPQGCDNLYATFQTTGACEKPRDPNLKKKTTSPSKPTSRIATPCNGSDTTPRAMRRLLTALKIIGLPIQVLYLVFATPIECQPFRRRTRRPMTDRRKKVYSAKPRSHMLVTHRDSQQAQGECASPMKVTSPLKPPIAT